MARLKRTQVTTTEAPAKSATSILVGKTNAKNGQSAHASADFDLEAAIRVRAYELYEKRGRQDGQAQTDWFQAEAELRPRVSRTA
jgi:hypothetical protein